MEGVTIQWEKTVLFSSGNMRTDLFRPMKRSVSDLNVSSKRKEKPAILEARQARAGSHVPVVSVQYDVPNMKTPPNATGFKFKRLHTPLAYQNSFKRSKSEDKITSDSFIINIPEFPLKRSARLDRRAEQQREEKKILNQLSSSTVDDHRFKGLGVGKCYEYYPPPTAPDHGRVPVPVTPATTPGNSRLGNYQSFSPSHYFPCHDLVSFRSANERLNRDLPNESPNHIGHSRQWQNVKSHNIMEEKPVSRKGSKRFSYLQSPLKFSPSLQDSLREDNQDETRSVHKGQGHTSQGSIQGDDMYGYNNSSSTPTVPYSTADILYGNEVNGRSTGDDVRQNSFVDADRNKPKSKELDYPGNIRRPNSKSGTRKALSIDAVAFEKDKEDQLKGFSSSLPPTTKPASHFRPNGIRSNILKGEQLYTASKQNGATNGKEPDDLVAMGTLWSPNNGQQTPQQQQQPPPLPTPSSVESSRQGASRSNSLSNNTNTNSYPSKVTSSSSNVHNSMSSSNNTLSSQRKYPSNSIRPIVNVQNNVSGKKNNLHKEQEEPKYTDPMIGAPPSFQQRIIELGALEGDTVRWERSKRLKKKKQDRDS